jgi:hypothetical protein
MRESHSEPCSPSHGVGLLAPQNDYKTLDTPFMESVWWVFKQLHEKGLVYRGFKVRRWAGRDAHTDTPCDDEISKLFLTPLV